MSVVPLSEEEQRILQEMEQSLLEHDREFVDRVSSASRRLRFSRGAKWSALGFALGTVLLLTQFRSSLLLGSLGVVVMTISALIFFQELSRDPADPSGTRRAGDRSGAPTVGGPVRRGPVASEIADERPGARRRMRPRFGRRD